MRTWRSRIASIGSYRPRWLTWGKIADCLLYLIIVPAWIVYALILWTVVLLRWCRRKYLLWRYEPRRTLLGPEEIAKRISAREERDKVRPLPAMRPRALTLGSQTATPEVRVTQITETKKKKKKKRVPVKELKQSTTDQLKTSTFWKFPFEIREVIWKYALGANHIHIMRGRQRLCNVYCPLHDPFDLEQPHLCTLSRDRVGVYVPTAWPKDVLPLSLPLSCRQIYSECIDFLYSENTFSFDNLSTADTFFSNLLPHRRQLISSVHIAFHYYYPLPRRYHLYIRGPLEEQNERKQAWQASCFATLQYLRNLPKLESLTITQPLSRVFLGARNSMSMVPYDEANLYMTGFFNGLRSVSVARGLKVIWSTVDYGFKMPEIPNMQYIEMPKRQSISLIVFFAPVNVRCLHCASYTIIRKGTKGLAESSFTTLNGDYAIGATVANDPKTTHYWTYHALCGGWIEFQFDWMEEQWSVTQGGVEISAEDAESHLLEHGDRYPKMLSPHEALQGVQTQKHPMNPRWQIASSRSMDVPTKATFYHHNGWAKTRGLKEPWEYI